MDDAIRSHGARLAGDSSGRYRFADRNDGIPDGVYAALRLTEIVARVRRERNERLAIGEILPCGERFLSPEKMVDFSAGRSFLDRFAERLRERKEKGDPIFSIREDHCSAVRLRCSEGWGVLRLRREEGKLSLRYGGATDGGFRRAGRLLRSALRETLEDAGLSEAGGGDSFREVPAEPVPAIAGKSESPAPSI